MKNKQFYLKDNNTILLLLFFLSGFTVLSYELVWIRELSVVFGKTIVAISTIVSVFMAGLGLGSLYWGRRIDRVGNPVKIFGILQFWVAASCMIMLLLFSILPGLYKSLYHLFNHSSGSSLIVIFFTSSLFMLFPTFMMGGTLPVIIKSYVINDKEIGSGIGTLYTVNTLGGIIGAGITGYWLLGIIGQAVTQLLSINVNVILGFAALILSSKEKQGFQKKTKVEVTENTGYHGFILTLSLLVAGLSGFCSLSYEILSIRALSIFLVNSSYSFSSILIIFLLGISIGSLLFTKLLSNKKYLLLILALSQTLIGIYLIMVPSFLNRLPILLFPCNDYFLKIPLLGTVFPGLFLSFILLFIPTVAMGVSFPAFCKVYTSSINKIGEKIGGIYLVNTIGSIIGPLVAAFLLIPLLGVVKSIIVIACINLFLGVLILIFERDLKIKCKLITVNIVLILISLIFLFKGINKSIIHPPSIHKLSNPSEAILYYNETTEGTVLVREDKSSGTKIRTLYVNNNVVCGIAYDAVIVVKMLGHLPFVINPTAKDVFILGFGTGITTAEVAKHTVKNIDCVEICPGLKEASVFFSDFNNNVVSNPKVNFIDGDGRNHLLLTRKKYDIISCDPTHPTLGCGNLYTREYFQLCKKHLNNNGVVSQYLPLHRLSTHDFKSIIKTFYSVFPNTTVWLAHSHCILLGTQNSYRIDFRFLKSFIGFLGDNMLNDPYRLSTSLFLSENAVDEFTKDAKLHTDDRAFLDFFSPASIKKENWYLNLISMRKYRVHPKSLIIYFDDNDKLARYLRAQEVFLDGFIRKNKSYKSITDLDEVIKLYKKAYEINPEDREIKTLLDNELKRYALIKKKNKQ